MSFIIKHTTNHAPIARIYASKPVIWRHSFDLSCVQA